MIEGTNDSPQSNAIHVTDGECVDYTEGDNIDERSQDRLIWQKTEVRENNAKYKFLPHFMGVENEIVHKVRHAIEYTSESVDQSENQYRPPYKTTIEKVKMFPLPALLWKVQSMYQEEQQHKQQVSQKSIAPSSSSTSSSKEEVDIWSCTKKKRDREVDNNSPLEDGDDVVREQKRRRSSFPVLERLFSWFQMDDNNEQLPVQENPVIEFFTRLISGPPSSLPTETHQTAIVMEVNEGKGETARSETIQNPENQHDVSHDADGWKTFAMERFQKKRKRTSSNDKKHLLFRDREEWFHYQVFRYLEHYRVMRHPIPSHHSIVGLIQRRKFISDEAVRFIRPKRERRTTTSAKEEKQEEKEEVVIDRTKEDKYLIGPGDNYGGDFTLYQGVDSPSEGHSVATIRVLYSNEISALDLLAFSRVQNKVAKAAILAFPSEDLKSSEKKIDLSEFDGKTKRKGLEGEILKEEEENVHFLVFNFREVSLRMS
eukprot:gene11361-12381_t